jgi:hypothetical protein
MATAYLHIVSECTDELTYGRLLTMIVRLLVRASYRTFNVISVVIPRCTGRYFGGIVSFHGANGNE